MQATVDIIYNVIFRYIELVTWKTMLDWNASMVVGSIMMNLHSILCKVNANSNNLHVLFKTAQFPFGFSISTIDYDNISWK